MKKTLLLPLLASTLLTACASTPPAETQNKPTVVGEQDIQRIAQQGQQRALDARSQSSTYTLAGVPPMSHHCPLSAGKISVSPKHPAIAGGKRIPPHKPAPSTPKN